MLLVITYPQLLSLASAGAETPRSPKLTAVAATMMPILRPKLLIVVPTFVSRTPRRALAKV